MVADSGGDRQGWGSCLGGNPPLDMPPPASSMPAIAPEPPRRAVVVLGMHRSGTSAVAGCLQRLGVDFGPRLMPSTPANPRGFYEHIDIVNLHDRLLLAAGTSWSDTEPRLLNWLATADAGSRFRDELREILRRDFATSPLWGVKDPRLCHLLPWWQPLWAELDTQPLFVLVLRDPAQVAMSLARRDGFSLAKGYLLWLQHVLAGERATRGCERVFVDFGELQANWRQALAPIGAVLGKAWPASAASEWGEEDFVDSAVAQRDQLAAGEVPPRWVAEIDAVLRRERRTGLDLFAKMDGCRADLEAAQALFGGEGERASDRGREFAALQQQGRWYEAEWQKARRRLEKARAQLDALRGKDTSG
jgi:hypothetical protein